MSVAENPATSSSSSITLPETVREIDIDANSKAYPLPLISSAEDTRKGSESSATTATPQTPSMRVAPTWPIIEIFGPVIHGEGEMIGRLTHFVRFGGCDYRCSWCDTLYAVLPEEVQARSKKMGAGDIVMELVKLGSHVQWVTLSGGNPGIFRLESLVQLLHTVGFKIAVETQGSTVQDWFSRIDCLTISPKPPSSGMITDWTKLDRIVHHQNANLKVVVFDQTDLQYARQVRQRYPKTPMTVQAGTRTLKNVSPSDVKLDVCDMTNRLYESMKSDSTLYDVRVLPQLHVLMGCR